MNRKLKIALKHDSNYQSEQGFALPLAVGMGMIMILVGMTMVMRSQGDQVTASAQKVTSQGQGAAETGITRFQSFINQYKAIATYCATQSNQPPSCNTGTTWSNVTVDTPGINNSCSPDAMNAVINTIQNNAATTWQNIDASDARKGQYRLVSYTYTPNAGANNNTLLGRGTLTIEGRVNQNNSASTATARLAVDIPVTAVPMGGVNTIGLWSTSFNFSGSGRVNSNVLDSSCDTNPFPSDRLGNLPNPPYPANTPGTVESRRVAFPPLPNNNVFAAPTNLSVNTIAAQTLSGNGSLTLPRTNLLGVVTDKSNGSTPPTYTYNVGCNGDDSISLSDSSSIVLGRTGEETIVLYLNCDLRASESTSFSVFRNLTTNRSTRVIIYENRNIQVSGNGFINPGPSENLQIYKYGTGSLNISGNGSTNAFVVAPQADTTLSGDGDIRGAIWTNTVRVSGNANISQGITDPSQLLARRQSTNPISSWRRQEAQ